MRKPLRKRLVITFDDLPLCEAVRKLFDDPEFVRSEALLIVSEGREWVLQKVTVHGSTVSFAGARAEFDRRGGR